MTVGQRIKESRNATGLTQEELGERLGVSGAAIAQYETGKRNPKYETLRRIGDALNIPVESLLGENDPCLLDDLYYRSVIAWSEDVHFSEAETTAIKKHLSDMLLRYKELIEATLQAKFSLLYLGSNATAEIIEERVTQSLQKKCDDLKAWIDSAPDCFSKAIEKTISQESD